MRYDHGGDIYSHTGVLDFSSNVSPLGLSPLVVARLKEIAEDSSILTVYPDPFCNALRCKLSSVENISADNIVCGNGAAELIYNICQLIKPKKALIVAPTFSEYEKGVKSYGGSVEYYIAKPENNFNVTSDIMECIDGKDIVFLCNPNNPTGRLLPFKSVCQIVKECKKKGAIVFVDECFMDFAENGKSSAELVNLYDNIIVLKAFTKMYAMAGLRLGYVLCSQKIASKIYEIRQPWSVSVIAQELGLSALEDKEVKKRTREYISKGRNTLCNGLCDLGISYFKSETNFILLRHKDDLKDRLLEKNILIRRCHNFKGLDNSYFRIAVKTEDENKMLLKALGEIGGYNG